MEEKNDLLKKLRAFCSTAKQEKKETFSLNDLTASAYTRAWQITREKRNELLERLCLEQEDLMRSELPYDILQYIGRICDVLGKLLSDMTGIDENAVVVSFFYKNAEEDDRWRQACRKEAKEEEILGQLIGMLEQVIGEKFEKLHSYYYVADKQESLRQEEYIPNRRDQVFHNEGSALYMKTDFENNGRKYIEGILVISTYGQTFHQTDIKCSTFGKSFENVLIYSVLPYFKQLLQTELGLIYMRKMMQRLPENRK